MSAPGLEVERRIERLEISFDHRQAEPHPPIASAAAARELGASRERGVDSRAVDSRTGVTHSQFEFVRVFRVRNRAKGDTDRSPSGELDRVCRQIQHDRAQGTVPDANSRSRTWKIDFERKMLLMVRGLERGHDLRHQVAELDFVIVFSFGARAGDCKIKNVFDRLGQFIGADIEALDNLARARANLSGQIITQDIEIAEQDLGRSAQLMREVRERFELNSVVPATRNCRCTAAGFASLGIKRPNW